MNDSDILQQAKEDWKTYDKASEMEPIIFPNGSSVTEFCIKCNDCKEQIALDLIRYKMSEYPKDVYLVNLMGFCNQCALITRGTARLRQSESFVRLEFEENGEWWVREFYVKKTAWSSIKNCLIRLWEVFHGKSKID